MAIPCKPALRAQLLPAPKASHSKLGRFKEAEAKHPCNPSTRARDFPRLRLRISSDTPSTSAPVASRVDENSQVSSYAP